jgi:hypothetical protein
MDEPSPLWRVPTSGGTRVKVLEGVFFGNFVVREGGIYYVDRPSGQRGVHYLDLPTGETRLQYLDLATRRTTTVARNLGNSVGALEISPDGRTISDCCGDACSGTSGGDGSTSATSVWSSTGSSREDRRVPRRLGYRADG